LLTLLVILLFCRLGLKSREITPSKDFTCPNCIWFDDQTSLSILSSCAVTKKNYGQSVLMVPFFVVILSFLPFFLFLAVQYWK
jgi:hypothetical protein